MRLKKNQPGYRKSRDILGRTTWRKDASPAQQRVVQSDHPLLDFSSTTQHINAQEVVDNLSSLGLYSYLAEDLSNGFYHSYSGRTPSLESINNVIDTSDNSTKPKGAFWLSKGEPDIQGLVTTEWMKFVREEALSFIPDTANLISCEFKNYAVILEFQGNDDIGKLLDLDCLIWKGNYQNGTYEEVEEYQDENGDWQEDYVEYEITKAMIAEEPLKYCAIDYPKLREYGIDAIRIQGDKFRTLDSAFLGWDVDSIAILRGDCLKGIHQAKSE